MKTICVFCSSSNDADPAYFDAAGALGERIAREGRTLIYGGTNVGLMGAVADAARGHGGYVVGIVPQLMVDRGIAHQGLDELIVTATLRERKALMDERADAFITLPGGIGTLEEVVEVLTLKQLQMISKPIVLLNLGGYYDPLLELIDGMISHRLAKPGVRALWHSASSVDEAFEYLQSYRPPVVESKWS